MLNCFTIVVVIAIAVTIGFVLAMIIKGRNSRTICRLEVSNLGNVRSRYDLKAEDDASALRFRFLLNGAALPQRQIVVASKAARPGASRAPAPASSGGGPGLSSLAGSLGNLLYSIGYLLPRSMGNPLIQVGSQLRQGQYTADRVGLARDQAAALTSSEARSRAPSSVEATPSVAGETTGLSTTATGTRVWVQTPFVEPGQTMTIDLFIDPARFHTQPTSYPFKVMSRSVEPADAAWVTDEWTAQVDSLSSLSRNTPLLVALGLVAIGLILSAAFCVNSTGILGR